VTFDPLVEPLDWPGSPLDLFRRIAAGRNPFLLLSDGRRGRWTLMGCDPFRVDTAGAGDREDPFAAVGRLLAEHPTAPAGDLPFVGGLVGFLGYECLRFVESVETRPADAGDPPDAWFGAYASAILLDHRDGRGWIVASGLPERDHASRRDAALRDVARLRERIRLEPRPPAGRIEVRGPVRSSLPAGDYADAVRRVLDHIRAGDVYQANLTQRLELDVDVPDPLDLFGRLHATSAAPHAAYLDLGRWQILSSSPERFVSLAGDRAESRPIKGTAPRGHDRAEDRRLRRSLLSSPKDRAENLMIVDLVRNDLNRVSRPGSVRVAALARPETYSTLHHLVSTVRGDLRPDCGVADLLRAVFPPGSMTGAPKVRAMEILHHLEPVRRGPYAGGLGYLSFAGRLDLSVVIRTVLLGEGMARFHVGGGVVADSDPEGEYRESLLKARALLAALGVD